MTCETSLEVCDSPEQAAHCHTLGIRAEGFFSDPTIGCLHNKEN